MQNNVEENICDTLYQCFFFTLTSGLRSAGGIGDAMSTPSFTLDVSLYFWRLVFDLSFFILIIVVVLNAGALSVLLGLVEWGGGGGRG